MYRQIVTTHDEALIHLFFHCCMKDGAMNDPELDTVSDMIVSAGLNKGHNLRAEYLNYKEYRSSIKDETRYLQHLIDLIRPVNQLALFSFCVELFLSDNNLGHSEEVLTTKIANLLHIDAAENRFIHKLITQLNDVKAKGSF